MCAQTSPFVLVISKGVLGNYIGLPYWSFLALSKRFSRHRVMPPEFHKKYFPIVTEKELDSYRDINCLDPNRKIPGVSPTAEAPRHLRYAFLGRIY